MAEKPQKIDESHLLNKENIFFLCPGRVSKTETILSENGRPEIFAGNFRLKREGWNIVIEKLKLNFSNRSTVTVLDCARL